MDCVNSVVFSHNGKLLASASSDTTIRLWDTATGVALNILLANTLTGQMDHVNSVAFSHDSALLVSAFSSGTVRLWEAATGTLRSTLEGHTDWVNSVAFSHDSALVASASSDTTIRLWDPATGLALNNLVGHTHRVNSGRHTRQLYDRLTRKEAAVLAQLRTGMARLNGYLYRINAAESDQCACGQARESVEHFPFRCTRWTGYRSEMLQCTDIHRSNMSFYLGGKSSSDNKNWTPNMEAVRATIRFAIATGRLEASQPHEDTS